MVSEGAAPHLALWGAAYASERRLLGMEPVHGIGGGAAAGPAGETATTRLCSLALAAGGRYGLWGACGPEDWAFPWLRCFSGPGPPC